MVQTKDWIQKRFMESACFKHECLSDHETFPTLELNICIWWIIQPSHPLHAATGQVWSENKQRSIRYVCHFFVYNRHHEGLWTLKRCPLYNSAGFRDSKLQNIWNYWREIWFLSHFQYFYSNSFAVRHARTRPFWTLEYWGFFLKNTRGKEWYYKGIQFFFK